jgi:cell division protein FtsB
VSKPLHIPLAPLLIAAAALALIYLVFAAARYVVLNQRLDNEETGLRAELHELGRDRERLVAMRDYLASDQYVIEVARRVLGLVSPGETLVIVSSTAPATSTPEAPTGQDTSSSDWWESRFFGHAPTPGDSP